MRADLTEDADSLVQRRADRLHLLAADQPLPWRLRMVEVPRAARPHRVREPVRRCPSPTECGRDCSEPRAEVGWVLILACGESMFLIHRDGPPGRPRLGSPGSPPRRRALVLLGFAWILGL